MITEICDVNKCFGCGLCAEVCPVGAIKIGTDKYGFLRPEIDGELCTECGKCKEACPSNKTYSGAGKTLIAAYAKDKSIRNNSSSGGVFALLAEEIVKKGGAVAAVGYDEHFLPVYKIAEDVSGIAELMGSKYSEAEPDGIYSKVNILLDEGRRVLFVGTPCRVAAMKSAAGGRKNLLTADVLCHGIAPRKLLEKFLSENFDGVTYVSFRDKTTGWQEFSMRVDAKSGNYRVSQYKDPYMRTFIENSLHRETCYDCPFKDDGYTADITLGDFWGISSQIPSMNDDGGTSAVIIRNEAGFSAFDEIKDKAVWKEASYSAFCSSNFAVEYSHKKPAGREEALSMLERGEPFSAIAEKFGRPLPARVIVKERFLCIAKKIACKIKK